MPAINLNNNAEVLAALPALLGFTPESSIVVLVIETVDRTESVRCALRFDIDVHGASQLTTAAAPVFQDATAAVLVAICGDWILEQAVAALDVLRDTISALDIRIHARLTTPDLDQPAQWIDIDTGAHGRVTSYRDSVFAAAKVFQGGLITAGRDQIVAEFTPTTNPVPVINEGADGFLIPTFSTVTAIINGSTHVADHPNLATRVGILITQNLQLRDTMLLLSIDQPGPAAQLWTHLGNQLTGAAHLQALTIAAACYYAAGDGVRAGIALDVAANDANAAHIEYPKLAQLLLAALQACISPTKLREVLSSIVAHDEH
jgi:hypothetical protein